MNRLAGALVATGSLIAATVALAPLAVAGTTDAPTLTVGPNPLVRGQYAAVTARILQGGTSYTFSSDDVTFAGAHSKTVTPNATGVYSVSLSLPAADPATDVTITLATTADSSVLASIDVPVAAPTIAIAPDQSVCPGQAVTILGKGFVEGEYLLHTDAGTTRTASVQTNSGAFISTLTTNATSSGNFTLTATPANGGNPAATANLAIDSPYVGISQFYSPWAGSIYGGCFAPGEQVALTSTGGVSLPASITATGYGRLSADFTNHPELNDQGSPITLTATGQTSGQRVVVNDGGAPRNALLPGDSLSGGNYQAVLASITPGYQFNASTCTAPIWHRVPAGMQFVWSALPVINSWAGGDGCSLTMGTDGDAVLYGLDGHPSWTSNTHVAGSRLVLGDDGGLRVISPTGIVLWNSAIAPSQVSVASSRAHSAVYINGLVQQRMPNAQLGRGVYRTVYLQRYLDGGWQNVLSRVTHPNGQLAVGFIQNTVYQYRLLLLATSHASGAISGSTFR